MRLVSWLVSYAVALAVAAWLLGGIWFIPRNGDWTEKIVPLLLTALILGALSAVVKPVLQFFSLPFIILTLGLFLLVINAAMLLLTSWLAQQLGVGFRVDGFWSAVWGAIIVTVVTWVVDGVLGED
ncbi:phage holin family protein [Nocardioides bruguierae]|uniref:Phage holin family protein n=1 Tax=Nocardioides bruguierae TaxID=2945102 RepID=A0A9X2IEH2_9ACTN|nr:phage holin family protein [Nocardioides bruguierae]MCL8024047.1 phage holin family protein [Nocardioides bruguierae]MCM0620287.1 phage holin family protein [Nocardioides bruguierae]